jgi:hypothetical protein
LIAAFSEREHDAIVGIAVAEPICSSDTPTVPGKELRSQKRILDLGGTFSGTILVDLPWYIF